MEHGTRFYVVEVPLGARECSSYTSSYWVPVFPHLSFHKNAQGPTTTCSGAQSWCLVPSPLIFHFNCCETSNNINSAYDSVTTELGTATLWPRCTAILRRMKVAMTDLKLRLRRQKTHLVYLWLNPLQHQCFSHTFLSVKSNHMTRLLMCATVSLWFSIVVTRCGWST